MLEENHLKVNDESWMSKWYKVFKGLKAPKDSGEYKYAAFEIQRTSSSFSASILTVAILILSLLVFVNSSNESSPPELEVTVIEAVTEPIDPIVEELPIEELIEKPDILTPEIGSQMNNDQMLQETLSEVSYGDNSTEDSITEIAVMPSDSTLVISGLLGGNRTTGGRSSAIGKYGGAGSDTVVMKALRWLKENQEYDGSWQGADSTTAMTGLALLCYMGHGETTSSPEFGTTIKLAIDYLLSQQDYNGQFKNAGEHYVYGHAIATYALAESYGMLQMHKLRSPIRKATEIILAGQKSDGTWDYDYNQGDRSDMSVSSWQIQALKAANVSGILTNETKIAMQKSAIGIKKFYSGLGFGYDQPGQSETLSAAGVLSLQLMGHIKDKAVANGLKAFESTVPSWPNGGGGTYAWYYITQAKFQNGGESWEKWNEKMLPMLANNQMDDGHWESNSTHKANPVYDTTICCLCLEVYYRILPSYEKIEDHKTFNIDDDDNEDILGIVL